MHSSSAGPMARQVTVSGSTCVKPLSTTKQQGKPSSLALECSSSNSFKLPTLSTTFFAPSASQRFTTCSGACFTLARQAWQHCETNLPFPIRKSVLTTIACLKLTVRCLGMQLRGTCCTCPRQWPARTFASHSAAFLPGFQLHQKKGKGQQKLLTPFHSERKDG